MGAGRKPGVPHWRTRCVSNHSCSSRDSGRRAEVQRQLAFPHEVLRTSRLMARLLLWSTGDLEVPPEDALAIARMLKAKLLALEAKANEELAMRARGPLACVETEETSNGEAAAHSEDELPW